MGIKTQKVLRLISKIILILVGVGLVGIAGYYVYKSIAFKPQNVVVTNITDGSATVTWTTTSPMKGIVYVKKDKALLPGPLGIVGSAMAYDDRDVSDAQKDCVDAFNKKASETKDSTFSVSGDNFDCENVKVTKMGSYYTHSVTMTNLDENSKYNFVVGDGIWSFKESVSTIETFSVLDTVGEPKPIFGKIVGDDGTYSRDAIVYITFSDGSESKDSIVYSSTTNDDGGWYLDASNARDSSGKVLALELTNDTFKAKGIYKNYGRSDEIRWVLGYFNNAYPDLTVVKSASVKSAFLDKFVIGAYAGAANCTYETVQAVAHGASSEIMYCTAEEIEENVSDWGAGNVVKALVASGTPLSKALETAGLSGGNIVTNGNINAIYGTSLNGTVAISERSLVLNTSSGTVITGTQTDTETGAEVFVSCSSNCTPSNSEETGGSQGSEGSGREAGACEYSTDCNKGESCQEASCTEITYKGYKQNDDVSKSKRDSGKSDEAFLLGRDNATSTYTITTADGVVTNIPSVISNIASEEGVNFLTLVTHPLSLYQLVLGSGYDISSWINNNDALKNAIEKELERLREDGSEESLKQIEDICKASGGGDLCPSSSTIESKARGISKVYAADTASSIFYLPEYGMYSFQLGDYTMSTSVSEGKSIYLFYLEANDMLGFQMPVDPDNPTSDEDIILSSNAYGISYKQESTAQQYAIKKGINIISFNFVPVSTDSGAYTAKDVISQALTNGVEVQYISTFEGGRWNSGYSCSSDTCTGTNFTIVPGKGYLIYATQDGTVTIPGYNLTSSVPVAFSAGWNLVGVHGYTTAYTARSFIDSVNKIEGLTANNVSWWPTSKSKYEGLEVDEGKEYGLDFSMSPNNGYFVRISKFAPTDTKCKSLIWNAGGSLNGTCGNTK